MQKNRNTTLAFDVLREEKKRTALWFTAFIVAFAVVIVDHITRKSGKSMRRLTIYDMEDLTKEKINSPRTVDRLVADELLEMGFSYSFMGTHYLHDSIVFSTFLKLEDFKCVNSFLP